LCQLIPKQFSADIRPNFHYLADGGDGADRLGKSRLIEEFASTRRLRVTPAMAAGLSEKVMDWSDIVQAMDADLPAKNADLTKKFVRDRLSLLPHKPVTHFSHILGSSGVVI
jgi:hypothetical protein